ncbi:MAG TPA: hypothetical protein PKX92_05020 [Edaphocola sp.]|nr:hypothetical protein [Edaphocola sp.]
MKKYVFFWTVSFMMIISRFFDVYSTWKYTPNLEVEWNPLVSKMGFNWGGLLIVQIAILLMAIMMLYYALFSFVKCFPHEKNLSFSRFVAFFLTGNNIKLSNAFFVLPKEKSRIKVLSGIFIPIAIICSGIITTLMWILMNNTVFYPKFHDPIISLIAIILLFFISCYCCLKILYLKYYVAI